MKLKILFQNRPNAFTSPGGDTIVMKRLKEHLERLGQEVFFSGDGRCDLAAYDIVHLFNLVIPEFTEAFAANIVAQRKPFAVTPLQENIPLFLNQSMAAAQFFQEYMGRNQERGYLPRLKELMDLQPAAPMMTSPIAVGTADKLFACGETEEKTLKTLYPPAETTVTYFGASIKDNADEISPVLFEEHMGVTDYVLCVGRLEARKNQLMLLKALEEDDIPVVLVGGGVSFQPFYEDLCRKFKRKGKTIFTDRLDDAMLVSAFKGARVHCLPSWYELPGLVSLEAALYGCNVAASSWGALGDYLGDTCDYCEPGNPESVRQAVLTAYEKPKDGSAGERARQFTWKGFAEDTLEMYKTILAERRNGEKRGAELGNTGFSSYDGQCSISTAVFLDFISAMLKEKKFRGAFYCYDRIRPILPRSAEVAKFDSLIGAFRQKLNL